MPRESNQQREFNNEFEYAWKRVKGDREQYALYFYLRGRELNQFEAITSVTDNRLFNSFKLDLLHSEVKHDFIRNQDDQNTPKAIHEFSRTLHICEHTLRYHETAKKTLNKLIDSRDLSELESVILRLHYGLTTTQQMTLEDIGKLLGVSRKKVEEAETKAYAKLTYP